MSRPSTIDQRSTTIVFTALALSAFAANSVLCRLALRQDAIDPATFSSIRFASGAVTLLAITGTRRPFGRASGAWASGAILALYAIPFAFAYVRLSTGTGALILFGAVQLTMLIGARRTGERITGRQGVGFGLALVGLAYLVSPGLSAPSPAGAVLMTIAGIAWGLYTLRGRGVVDPLLQATSSFVRSLPFIFGMNLVSLPHFHVSRAGLGVAVLSGAVASALGYVAWFAALRGLTAVRAAVVQLAVPVIAAAGGVILLSEPIPLRLVVASILVLGGIGLVVATTKKGTTVTGKS
jgi:drug/metabolite transporter (DMT)-like permease